MNNNVNKFFNYVSLILLAIALPLSVYIIRNGEFDFRIEAFLNDEPQNVNITDIKADSAKVSWFTEKSVIGQLKLTNSIEPITETKIGKYHELIISNLDPLNNYTFQIYSDGKLFPTIHSLTTYENNYSEDNHFMIGQVFSTNGLSTQDGGLIYLKLKDNLGKYSQRITTAINEIGGYKFNLSGIRYEDGAYFDHNGTLDIELEIFIDPKSENVIKIYTLNLNNDFQIPNIYLAEPEIDIIPGVQGDQ